MAWLFGDSFDIYNYQATDAIALGAADLVPHWTTANLSLVSQDGSISARGPTRFNHGKSAEIYFGSFLTKTFGEQPGTLFLSFAVYFGDDTIDPSDRVNMGHFITVIDQYSNELASVIFQPDLSIKIMAGTHRQPSDATDTGTQLSLTPTAYVLNRWYWVQIKIVAAAVQTIVGSDHECQSTVDIAVHFDGSATAVATGAGTDTNNIGTRLAGGGPMTVGIYGWAQRSVYFDDVMMWNDEGGNPSGFSDILRFELKNPITNRRTAFAPFPTVTPFGADQPSDTPVGLDANTILYSSNTYPPLAHSGVAVSLTIPIVGTLVGPRFRAALYLDNGVGRPGLLLGVTKEGIGFNGQPVDLPFASNIIVTRGKVYHWAIMCDTVLDPSGVQGPILQGVASTGNSTTNANSETGPGYASGFPPVASASSFGIAGFLATLNVVATDNFSFVAGSSVLLPGDILESNYDDYLVANAYNDFDLYNIEPLAGTPTIVGVQTRAYLMAADAGVAKASVMLQSGVATAFDTLPTALPSGPTWVSRFDNVDPATSAAFTPAGLNNVAIGVIDLTSAAPAGGGGFGI